MSDQQTIGGYTILSRLGKGGMACVYKATAPGGRTVALKVISGEYVQKKEFVRRFSREAKVYAQLDHAGIVRVHDSGVDGDQYWVAMDVVEGKPLETKSGGPADVSWAVRTMIKVLDALHHAHGKGVVHRDLKPANIVMKPDGEPILLDFGIAFVTDSTAITQEGNFLGTPAYVAPEMVRGGGDTTPAFDLYSVGVMLYELTTGRLPFESDSPMGMLFKHMQERATAPRMINPQIGKRLQAAILRALEKDPQRRHASAAAMAQELAAALEEDARSITLDEVESSTAGRPTAEINSAAEMQLRTFDFAPEDLPASIEPAVAAWKAGNHVRAVELLDRMCAELPAWPRLWSARLLLARCAFETRAFLRAVREFKAVVDECPTAELRRDAMIGLEAAMSLHIRRGETLIAAGDAAGAKDIFATLKEIWLKDTGNPLYRAMWLGVADRNLYRCESLTPPPADEAQIDTKKLTMAAAQGRPRSRAGWIAAAAVVALPLAWLATDPPAVVAFRAKRARARGDAAAERQLLERLVLGGAAEPATTLRLARLRTDAGETRGALTLMERAMLVGALDEELTLDVALRLEKAGNPRAAVSLLRALVTRRPRLEPAWLALRRVEGAGDRARERAVLEEMARAIPESAPVVLELAEAAFHAGDLGKAAALVRPLVASAAPPPGAPRLLAAIQAKSGDPRGALETLEAACAKGSGAPGDWLEVAIGWEKQLEPVRALTAYQKALAAKADDAAALARVTALLLERGLAADALAHAKKLAGLPGQRTAANLLALARALVATKDGDEARKVLAELRARGGATATADELEGDLADLKGDVEAAIDAYDRALAATPPAPGAGRKAGALLARRGNATRAADYYRRGLELDPKDRFAWTELGRLAMDAGDHAQAVDAFRRTVELDARSAAAQLNLGIALRYAGDREQAVFHLQESLRLAPMQPEAGRIRDLIAGLQEQ